MDEPIIIIELQGDQCRVTMPPDARLKVKIHANQKIQVLTQPVTDENLQRMGRKRRHWEPPDSNMALLTLLPDEHLVIDVYGGDSGGHMLHQEYQRTDTSLEPLHSELKSGGPRIEIRQEPML